MAPARVRCCFYLRVQDSYLATLVGRNSGPTIKLDGLWRARKFPKLHIARVDCHHIRGLRPTVQQYRFCVRPFLPLTIFKKGHSIYTYTSQGTEFLFKAHLRADADNGEEENQGPERGEACV